jgi:hypothetical protein
MSALAQKADIDWRQLYVRFVPKAEVARTELIFRETFAFCYRLRRCFSGGVHSRRPAGVWRRMMGLAMADVPIGHARIGAANAFDFQSNVLAWILASAAMLLALMAPALWNGFPLIFPDTGGYLDRPILGTLGMGRSALYGLFLYTGAPFSFWPNVVLQSALTVWLIVLTMRAHGLGGRPWLTLGIVAMLTVCTSLPWFSAQLMPDILFPAVVLALYLLSFHNEGLVWWERFILAAVTMFAITSHMAAAGMCVAVIAALWLSARFKPLGLTKPRKWFAAGSVAAGIVLCPISNLAITGNFAFTPGASSFLFGRLIEDGIIARYLDERCPDASLRLCDFKATLPKDAGGWLWDDDTPFRELGGWKGFGAEERVITRAISPHARLDRRHRHCHAGLYLPDGGRRRG